MATRLQKLEIDEVSGVQNPANELPGFLVAKSTDLGRALTADEISKEVDRMESDYAILYSALQACQQYMTDAPPEVTAAVDTLTQYIEGLFSDTPPEDPNADPNAQQPVQQSAGGQSLFQRLMGAVGVTPTTTASTSATTKSAETTKETPTVSETASTEAAASTAAESTETTKSAEPTVVNKELTDALTLIATGLGDLTKTVKDMQDTQAAQSEALSSTLDRLSAVEANRAGVDITDTVITEPTQKSTDRGEDALRSALVGIARRPGTSVTLGRGT